MKKVPFLTLGNVGHVLTLSFFVSVSALVSTACSTETIEESVRKDLEPPLLEVVWPPRGYISDSDTVKVAGRVTDINDVTVTINGVATKVNPNGSFEKDVRIEKGITFLQTVATDKSDNQITDNRSTLFGDFSANPTITSNDSIALRINQETMDAMAQVIDTTIEETDFATPLVEQSPMFLDDNGCTQVQLTVDDFRFSNSTVVMTPVTDGMSFDMTIHNLVIEGDIRYKSALQLCAWWSNPDYTITADFINVTGVLKPSLDGNDVVVAIENVVTVVENLDIDSGLFVEMAFLIVNVESIIDENVRTILEDEVPPLVESFFADFTNETEISVLDSTIRYQIIPSLLSFDTQGGILIGDTKVSSPDVGIGSSIGYFLSPSNIPSWATSPNKQALQMAMADDFLNQLFTTFWNTGALNRTVDIAADSQTSLGGLIGAIQIEAKLPPIAKTTTGDRAQMQIGDLIINILEKDTGDRITSLAMSLTTNISAKEGPNGGLLVATSDSLAVFDVLEDNVEGANVLAEIGVENFFDFLGSRIDSLISQSLGEFELPSFAGLSIENVSMSASQGYLGIQGSLNPE